MTQKNFKVRSFEEVIDITAERMALVGDGVRFFIGERVTSAFSRYLWIQEQTPAPEPVAPTEPVEPEPVPEPKADPADAT
ncbi:hypothetical protein [Pseudomonas sp. Au-Pse12]|uniref:hypothetical protein n=1 Tax=Pseudomonas sp. Au-Pse12 TaxID=2906459 RepID=UPI001E51D808|nr:hypothetical protein [Pseudomonas sp. Au-Pse12]MCE4056308.1 hypothetical protein [Pseudomonas sp. Au-Pse12]